MDQWDQRWEQRSLFDPPRARRSDPDTSHSAAEAARRTAGTHRAIVLATFRQAGGLGLTDFELADLTGLGDSARKRRADLRDEGYLFDSQRRRLSPSGQAAIVWKLTPERERNHP